MRILFLTTSNVNNLTFGGGKGSHSRYELFKQIAEVELFQILKESNFASFVSLLQNKYPPLRNSMIDDVMRLIINKKIDIVYIDTSCCGTLAKCIKEKLLNVPIIIHFQNCESDYNLVRFAGKHNLKSMIYSKLIRREEKFSLKYSDYTISLSQRDAQRIKDVYGDTVNETIPLFVKDEFYASPESGTMMPSNYCLLFGSDVFANVTGFRWFIRSVSPHIPIKTIVAGKGMEKYKLEFESYAKNVEVVGFIENLRMLYQNANCVCMPLFIGGGMKVKTVEALMYGKTIFGTDEAFSGFDFDIKNVAAVCNDAEGYISKITAHCKKNSGLFNVKARQIYEQVYSEKAALASFAKVISAVYKKSQNDHN